MLMVLINADQRCIPHYMSYMRPQTGDEDGDEEGMHWLCAGRLLRDLNDNCIEFIAARTQFPPIVHRAQRAWMMIQSKLKSSPIFHTHLTHLTHITHTRTP
jgi:hypothetical protein